MSYRREAPFEIEATAKELSKVIVQRGDDFYLLMTVRLPDIDAPIISTSVVDEVYMDIRDTPDTEVASFRADTSDYITVTRPSPNTMEVEIHIPDTVTRGLGLGRSPSSLIGGGSLRGGFPGAGFSDLLAQLASGDRHYFAAFAIEARVMVTKDWSLT